MLYLPIREIIKKNLEINDSIMNQKIQQHGQKVWEIIGEQEILKINGIGMHLNDIHM